MGEISTMLADLPALAPPPPAFEMALNRFKKAFEESRPSGSEVSDQRDSYALGA
jgi:hypothetical protein